MKLILIRHAKADYSYIKQKKDATMWKNLAGLSELGKKQAIQVSNDNKLAGAELILTSPYTRALETAYIISKEIKLPVNVEFDLREWEQEKSKQFEEEEFNKMLGEMIRNKGVYSKKCKYKWESLSELGNRVFDVIKKYKNYNKIIVVTHMMVINQFLYKEKINNCEIIEFDFNANSTKPNGFMEL